MVKRSHLEKKNVRQSLGTLDTSFTEPLSISEYCSGEFIISFWKGHIGVLFRVQFNTRISITLAISLNFNGLMECVRQGWRLCTLSVLLMNLKFEIIDQLFKSICSRGVNTDIWIFLNRVARKYVFVKISKRQRDFSSLVPIKHVLQCIEKNYFDCQLQLASMQPILCQTAHIDQPFI